MLKRGLAFALALVMLASVSVAGATGMEIEKNGQWYTEVSAWAKDGVEKAIDLGVAYWPSRGDAKTSLAATLRRTPLLWWRWRMALTWQRMKDSVCYS